MECGEAGEEVKYYDMVKLLYCGRKQCRNYRKWSKKTALAANKDPGTKIKTKEDAEKKHKKL